MIIPDNKMFDINTMMRRSTRPRVKRAKRTVYGRKKRGVMRRKNPTHFFKRCAASFTISNSSATQGTAAFLVSQAFQASADFRVFRVIQALAFLDSLARAYRATSLSKSVQSSSSTYPIPSGR